MKKDSIACCVTSCCADEDKVSSIGKTNMMDVSDEKSIKSSVRNKYAAIALAGDSEGCCSFAEEVGEVAFIGDDYKQMEGYIKSADLGLGCGLPTEFAQIKTGDVVVDLGSGAGNDAFIARKEAGETGKVYGIDFTEEMIQLSRKNNEKLGFENVHFFQGDIDDMPLENNLADVVVSNCVLNLVPNKKKVFSEIRRILKKGGHFSISDVVTNGEVPEALKAEAELYAGCVAGAIPKEEYLALIEAEGFSEIQIQKERKIEIPADVLQKYLSPEKMEVYKNADLGIFSITVFAKK